MKDLILFLVMIVGLCFSLSTLNRLKNTFAVRLIMDVLLAMGAVQLVYGFHHRDIGFAPVCAAAGVLVVVLIWLDRLVDRSLMTGRTAEQIREMHLSLRHSSRQIFCVYFVAFLLAFVFQNHKRSHDGSFLRQQAAIKAEDDGAERVLRLLHLPSEIGGVDGIGGKPVERDLRFFRGGKSQVRKTVSDGAPLPISNDSFDYKLVSVGKDRGELVEAKYFRFYEGSESLVSCSDAVVSLLDRLEWICGCSFACRRANRRLESGQVKDGLRRLFQFGEQNTLCEWQSEVGAYRLTVAAGVTDNGRTLLVFRVRRSETLPETEGLMEVEGADSSG